MAKKKHKKVETVEYVSFYNKPTSTYVMSATIKRMLALMPFKTKEERNHYKKMMIQAELSEREARNKPWSMTKKDREDVSDRT